MAEIEAISLYLASFSPILRRKGLFLSIFDHFWVGAHLIGDEGEIDDAVASLD